MNITDAISEIESRGKAYLDVEKMDQGTFANTIRAIKLGYAKPSTTESFMAKFGYVKIKVEENWIKTI